MISHLAANRGSEPETPRALAAAQGSRHGTACRARAPHAGGSSHCCRGKRSTHCFSLRDDYGVLRAGTRLAARYSTRYFDTSDLRMYDDHRRGRCPRYKVRMRHHLDRTLSFLEVKRKGTNQQTTKAILSRPFGAAELDSESRRFIDGTVRLRPYPRSGVSIDSGEPRWSATSSTSASPSTGISIFTSERRGTLRARRHRRGEAGAYSNHTPAIRALRAFRIREQSISKHCIATAAVAAVRSNTFKSALRAVERL